MKIKRTWFAADKTGFHMLHTLFQTSLRYGGVRRFDEWFVTKLLVDGGRCQGVVAIELATGKIHGITAKAVILCTGGCGKIFPFTTNANIKNGDGMALAYRAGVPLKDMEFVQYHPTGLPQTGILITEAARAEGGWMLNKDGYRYLQDYDLGTPTPEPVLRSMELGPRDRLSQAFIKEQERGRTLEGPYGHYVNLDIRHIGEQVIDKKLPFVRELCRKYANLDPVREMIPVRPVVHYMMGGVHTDIDGVTPIPGLYAAGEAACVSLNGANRLGSNSLTECLVFGARAGKVAAEYASGRAAPGQGTLENLAGDERKRIERTYLQPRNGKERVADIRTEMQAAMERGAGIFRNEETLKETCEVLRKLQERFRNVGLDDTSSVFNTELTAALELGFMLDAAEALAHAALDRKESRGSHSRSDFEDRDDEEYLKHSLTYRTDAGPRTDYLPVTITRWQPEERKY
jgi:fumarate reductase flavoprotein subunit